MRCSQKWTGWSRSRGWNQVTLPELASFFSAFMSAFNATLTAKGIGRPPLPLLYGSVAWKSTYARTRRDVELPATPALLPFACAPSSTKRAPPLLPAHSVRDSVAGPGTPTPSLQWAWHADAFSTMGRRVWALRNNQQCRGRIITWEYSPVGFSTTLSGRENVEHNG